MESSLGDMAILGKMFQEHRPRLLAMLRRRIDPALTVRVDPEEVLQEAFFVAQRRFEKQQEGTMTPYAWLYRIALDCLFEAWSRETRMRRDLKRDIALPAESTTNLGFQLIGSQTSPSGAAQRNQTRDCMRQVVGMLGTRDREVLWMRYFDQLTHADIATVLGISENAATVRCFRALGRLKTLWEKVQGSE